MDRRPAEGGRAEADGVQENRFQRKLDPLDTEEPLPTFGQYTVEGIEGSGLAEADGVQENGFQHRSVKGSFGIRKTTANVGQYTIEGIGGSGGFEIVY